MGIEDFRVVLKDEVAVYFPGQTVHGKVHFTLTKSVSSKGKSLNFELGLENTFLIPTSQKAALGRQKFYA